MTKNNDDVFGCGPVFPVEDIQASADYYRDKLGFTLDFVEGGHGSVTRCKVGVQFTKAPKEFQARNYPGWTYFFVNDVDSLCDEFRAKGVQITAGPTSHDHGMREFQIEDINGFRLRFGQYLE